MSKLLLPMLAVVLMAGLATAQTIDEIQFYNPETGEPESPFDGQIVTVQGVIYCPAGIYNNGTHYLLGETGGISFTLYAGLALAALGLIGMGFGVKRLALERA